jgi:hypothetical protein
VVIIAKQRQEFFTQNLPFWVKFRWVINLYHVVTHYFGDYNCRTSFKAARGDTAGLGGECHGSGGRWRVIRHATNSVLVQYQCFWNDIPN